MNKKIVYLNKYREYKIENIQFGNVKNWIFWFKVYFIEKYYNMSGS